MSTESSDDDATERLTFVVSEDDWFSEVEEDDSSSFDDWESQPAFSISGSGTGSFEDLGDPHIEEEFAAKVSTGHENSAIIELYDSGTTRHISPYREHFETMSSIPPKPFVAANKQRFNATGIGELVIEVPEVGYTLVSIGRLDDLGYSTTFADGTCTIHDASENVIGTIPKDARGLYRVDHGPDSVHAADETITVMELHRRMGHIAPSTARRLLRVVHLRKGDPQALRPMGPIACSYPICTS